MVTRVGRGVGSGQDTQENVELKVGVCYEEQDLKGKVKRSREKTKFQ